MRSKFKWIFTLIMAFSMQFSFAQEKTVTGVVSDALGPLGGANIVVQGTTNGTTTDFDGKYTLENVAADAVLQITFVGYGTRDISVAGKSVVDVVLVEESDVLEQVVVVGYGVKKKSLVTGAIGSLDSKEIENSSSPRVEQVLQGRVSGVTVVSSSGSPGWRLLARAPACVGTWPTRRRHPARSSSRRPTACPRTSC